MKIAMTMPGGSGTGVWRFGYLDGSANPTFYTDQPCALMSGYGQFVTAEFNDAMLYSTGRCYMQTVSASWSVGDAKTYMSMRYVGPPLEGA